MNKHLVRAALVSASLASLTVVPFAASAQAADACSSRHLAYLNAQERLDKATADPAARQAGEQLAEAQAHFDTVE
ncbi:hypothetical protein [Streptomyces boluensis]|uniref:Uncharacterized protein n=1 Tax=Streptomyces boluensis TaxID=1775135 RepID=A0A964UU20_9ACTN|nr:hypothetical protein [Streptomyces boluensis]NBE54702.1 hypothetical protein [Streptomyces boluensis]